jgi:1,4-dihydroxy-2-naphthoate octaprenyltransferase
MTGGRTAAWAVWKMARPSQLLLVALVYALGASVAWTATGRLPLDRHARGLPAMLAVTASVHYANEYADAETDRLTDRTPFSGGSGALPRTGLPRSVALAAGAASLVLAGVLVATVGRSLPPLALGGLGVVAVLGWQYSLSPLAFAWRGLGEVVNALLGGVLLPLYAVAVAAGRVWPGAVVAVLPFAVAVFLNLLDTQWPDRRADGAVGKASLAVLWSPDRLHATYTAGIVAFVAATLLLATNAPLPVTAVTAAAIPALVFARSRYTVSRSPFPSVAAMVGLAVAQTLAWVTVAL